MLDLREPFDRYMSLSSNRIQNLTNGCFNGLGNLKSVDLTGSNLPVVNASVFVGLGNVTYVYTLAVNCE